VTASLILPGLVQAQGIADVAKREKSRVEQANQQPAQVYTNVGGASASEKAAADAPKPATAPPPAPMPAATSAGTPHPVAPAPDRVATTATARDAEVYWRARARVAQAAIDDAQSRIDQLEGEAAEAAEAGDSEAAAATGPCAQAVEDARNGTRARRSSGKRACDVEVMRVRRSQALDAALDDARRQLDAARGAQDALVDDARRAGVRSDWLR
jgi:hypothetical protein